MIPDAPIQILDTEVEKVITYMKGGKALSVNNVSDTVFTE